LDVRFGKLALGFLSGARPDITTENGNYVGRIPVRVITTRAALVGAASFGLETYKHKSGVAA
jgi:hypothetical protein